MSDQTQRANDQVEKGAESGREETPAEKRTDGPTAPGGDGDS